MNKQVTTSVDQGREKFADLSLPLQHTLNFFRCPAVITFGIRGWHAHSLIFPRLHACATLWATPADVMAYEKALSLNPKTVDMIVIYSAYQHE